MPNIKPFRAWRYDTRKVNVLSQVVAPPYDIISPKEQERLYHVNPHNVIRLELGRKKNTDNDKENRYTRAKNCLHQWKKDGILIRESAPALYVHVQNYIEEGKKKQRIGYFAAMKVDEKDVLKHENTLTGPKEDRLKLLKEVRTNLSPIFGLFEDKKGVVQTRLKKVLKNRPLADVSLAGVRHRLYREERKSVLDVVVKAMRNKPMFIADGHHRFEVACQFRKWAQSQKLKGREWEYVLTYFSDVLHNPFKIFPTHRLLRVQDAKRIHAMLAKIGKLEKAKDLKQVLRRLEKPREQSGDLGYTFGIFTKKEGFWLLTLDSRKGGTNPVDRLDVAVLHQKVLEPCFNIRAVEKSAAIDFTRDASEAEQKVRGGDFDLAMFLRPTSLHEMLFVSKKGLKMPQKSTYFYPKLLTGLVFHGLEAEAS